MANTPGNESPPDNGTAIVRLKDYAVALYGRADVSSACLLLQTNKQIDVNLLLFVAWAIDAGRIPSAQNIADAQARVRAWHEDVVRSIRKVRQRLKSGPPPAPSADTNDFREKIKKLEIQAELIELDHLEPCLASMEAASIKDIALIHERVAKALTLIVVHAGGCQPDQNETNAILHIATEAQTYAEDKARDTGMQAMPPK